MVQALSLLQLRSVTLLCLVRCRPAVVDREGHGDLVKRQRHITSQLPPCLFVPHTIQSWQSLGSSPVAGEALATIGICTLDAVLQAGHLMLRLHVVACGQHS
jgi:hypothetical protein